MTRRDCAMRLFPVWQLTDCTGGAHVPGARWCKAKGYRDANASQPPATSRRRIAVRFRTVVFSCLCNCHSSCVGAGLDRQRQRQNGISQRIAGAGSCNGMGIDKSCSPAHVRGIEWRGANAAVHGRGAGRLHRMRDGRQLCPWHTTCPPGLGPLRTGNGSFPVAGGRNCSGVHRPAELRAVAFAVAPVSGEGCLAASTSIASVKN